jgi:hypothetical protein
LIQHTLNWLRPVVIDNTILTENLEELCWRQKTFSDEMGHWCSTTYLGQNGRQLTAISAYQICDSPPVADTSNPTTSTMKTKAVTQQYSMMVEKGLPLDRHSR